MKNPIIAGALNFFLPGAGYLYVGGKKKRFGFVLMVAFILLYTSPFYANFGQNPLGSQTGGPLASPTQTLTSTSSSQGTQTQTVSGSQTSTQTTSASASTTTTTEVPTSFSDQVATIAAFLLLFAFAYDGYNEAQRKR